MLKTKFSSLISRIFHYPGMPVCDGEEIEEVDFNFCDPNIRTSEIRRVFLALPIAAEFVDWTSASAWYDRISQTSNDVNAIRPITCIGDKPVPSSIKKALSFNRNKITSKTHTLLITIDEVTSTNHSFIQWLKKGKYLRTWYETTGRYLFGGPGGIVAMVTGDMILTRGEGEIVTYQVQITWKSLRTEDRIESPIFDDEPTGGEVLLNEDGTPLLNEDGSQLLSE